MFTSIHHIHYVVRNRDEMVEYIRNNFGMEPDNLHVVEGEGDERRSVSRGRNSQSRLPSLWMQTPASDNTWQTTGRAFITLPSGSTTFVRWRLIWRPRAIGCGERAVSRKARAVTPPPTSNPKTAWGCGSN